MFSEVHGRLKKIGQPPGTAMYTGEKINTGTSINALVFDSKQAKEVDFDFLKTENLNVKNQTIWINVEGLSQTNEINELASIFELHPLTIEDILNIEQRPKVDFFDKYIYVTLRALKWNANKLSLTTEQISFILGKNFIISFQEYDTNRFYSLRKRIDAISKQGLKKNGADYILYRLIDEIVDEYFVVFNSISDEMEVIEQNIIYDPTPKHAKSVYIMKNQLVILRKAIWPMREVVNHLLNDQNHFISTGMHVYLRDLYDHVAQSIDTLETFRDMLSTNLDMYFSSLTNRMNEIMKTLTIISTIFIPITAVASIYGMNFDNLPGIHNRSGYLIVFSVMLLVTFIMLIYFKKQKWL